MELIEIAQLVTGLATLIVASVLIWQMFIQKKTLDIAHNDADSSMSLDAISQRTNLSIWFSEKCTDDFLAKLNGGIDRLSDQEKEFVRTWFTGNLVITNTEYRLGRLDRNPHYYKSSINRILRFKATQDILRTSPIMRKGSPLHQDLADIVKEAFVEITGEKLELTK
mgnify:FL=1